MRIASPRAALALAATLTLAIAACDDTDAVAPGIGFPEAGELRGGLEAEANATLPGVVANRSGTLFVRACGPSDANFDFLVTSGRATDTVAVAAATGTGCEAFSFAVEEGRTYRFRPRAVSGRGTFVICYAYEQSACASLEAPGPAPANVPAGYYANAEGLRDTALVRALSTIIRNQRGFLYDSARGFLYQSVEDPDSNDVITDLYAGRSATVDRRANSATDAGDANFNAEHAWPQSCGARTDTPAGPRGDLHILFASDETANSRRGNNPYGVVTGTPTYTTTPPTTGAEVSRLGPASDGTIVFEPRPSRRGDVARAIFYYYVRYVSQNPQGVSLENFVREEPTLRAWAQADPVDDFERARHEVVFQVQGNRNPFVDRPDLLARIGDFPNEVAGTASTCSF